ncbi:hypothetical protein QJU23_05485 [Pasteurella atlantica]|uniref:Uncharacterized protein n=2 Tax=Pasteurellaceae TaxID=712 RepID=A0ACC6HM30_9PAST|nr:hypothetical protein [Pasteurella atlantica]MDP8051868.1 hypothetical protein [Pasteurella atlantica]
MMIIITYPLDFWESLKYDVYGDGEKLDDVCYFYTEKGYIGFFINGVNPYFTTEELNSFDSFNLFSVYEKVECVVDSDFSSFDIKSIKLVFCPSYNELLGFFISNETSNVISIIFQYDSIKINFINKIDFKKELEENLRHFNYNELIFLDI